MVLLVLATACTSTRSSPQSDPQPSGSAGTRYYVRAEGSDAADGRSAGRAWRTLARASAQQLRPGDSVVLEGGEDFQGPLVLDADDRGASGSPIVLTSTGLEPARITGGGSSGIYIHNTSGIAISRLALVGGDDHAAADGIAMFNDTGSRSGEGITIADVDVSGFTNGISVGGPSMGFAGVTVRESQVHDNVRDGLTFYGPRIDPLAPVYANADVLVDSVQSYGNTGQADDLATNSGSGIIIGSTERATVTRSVAHGNGALCNASLGPSGIWSYDSTLVLFERNLSYSNRTGTGTADGNGFDLDVNTSNSVMQYNMSYDNDGAGFFVFTFEPNGMQHGNVVRYNVSSNDVRRRAFYAGLMIAAPDGAPGNASGASKTQLYSNTIVMTSQTEGQPAAFRMYGNLSDILIANNIFVTSGGSPSVVSDGQQPDQVLMAGNLYFSADSSLAFQWNRTKFTSVQEWSRSTGQEQSAGAFVGTSADPGLPGPFAALSATAAAELPSAANLIPPSDSPAGRGGVDLAALGVDRGPRTFFGPSHPCPGPGIGASC